MKEKIVLLFGFNELPLIMSVAAVASRYGARVRNVSPEEYQLTLEDLAAGKKPARESRIMPLGGKMLVLCGLDEAVSRMVEDLRAAGAGADCVKAVLTDTNRSWTAQKLFTELHQERRAIERENRRRH